MGSPKKKAPLKDSKVVKKPSAGKAKSAPSAKGSKAKKGAKPAKASGKSARAKSSAPALSVVEKQRMLKPLVGFSELLGRLVSTWKAHGRLIKVPGLSPASLLSKLKRALRASEREEALRARLESKLQPLADARLRAEHDAWKSALDLHAMVKTAARTNPALSAPFEFFGDAFAKRKGGGAGSEGESEGESEGAGGEG